MLSSRPTPAAPAAEEVKVRLTRSERILLESKRSIDPVQVYADSTNVLPLFAQANGAGPGLVGFLPLILIFVIFYFLLIRPQQVKQKKWNQVLGTLKNGDQVTTSGGMRGTITRVKDDAFVLRVAPDGLQIEVVKSAVIAVTNPQAS